MGLFTNYAELGQRNFTQWRSLATDVFVQDSWKPTSQLTVEGGVRWVYWPPWYSTTNNIANFDPRFYDPAQAAVIDPATGPPDGRRPLQRHRAARRRVRGRRHAVGRRAGSRRAGALPRRAARLLRDARERLRAAPRGWPTSSTRRPSSHERRHVPQPRDAERLDAARRQRAVPAAGRRSPTAAPTTRAAAAAPRTCRSASPAQDVVFKHPTSYMWSAGVQREIPFGFIGRCELRRAARACTCSASATSISCCPGTHSGEPWRQHRRAAALHGLRRHPALRERGAVRLQQLPDQRRSSLHERAQGRLRLHARQVGGQRQRQAQRAVEHLRRQRLLGAVELRSPPRAGRLLHLRPAVLQGAVRRC